MPVFLTESGRAVPSVTADEMREVDRVAVETVELGLLQMMENAGRTLAGVVRDRVSATDDARVVVLAGAGGNGGGGLCAARHLHNRGLAVGILLDRDPSDLTGAAGRQYRILSRSGVDPTAADDRRAESGDVGGDCADTGTERANADDGPSTVGDTGLVDLLADADLLVDALIGYGLSGPPRGTAANLIGAIDAGDTPVVSLDVPSGLVATTGETPGVAVSADVTLTLALPKTGFATDSADPTLRPAVGDLRLADIAVPPTVYRRTGVGTVDYRQPFDDADWVRLVGVRR
jgi:NAD(P)H-hydrate epimerase